MAISSLQSSFKTRRLSFMNVGHFEPPPNLLSLLSFPQLLATLITYS